MIKSSVYKKMTIHYFYAIKMHHIILLGKHKKYAPPPQKLLGPTENQIDTKTV